MRTAVTQGKNKTMAATRAFNDGPNFTKLPCGIGWEARSVDRGLRGPPW